MPGADSLLSRTIVSNSYQIETNICVYAKGSVSYTHLDVYKRQYLTRTRPMMRDRKVEAISTSVAVKAVCACDGRNNPRPRAHLDRVAGEGSVEGHSATGLDSNGVAPFRRAKPTLQPVPSSKRAVPLRLSLATGHSADELAFLWTETAHSSFVN